MRPRISVITLGVDNLDQSLAFYRDGLGLTTPGIIGKEFEHGAVVFFDLQPGLKLALWPRDSISFDTGIPKFNRSPTELTLGHNVSSREEVDAIMAQARRAGAKSSNPRRLLSGEATLAISRTRTITCGKSCGIPNSKSQISADTTRHHLG
jgi:catechol 2,3-dioxygenase-like lactoylglutathione lyase family enzyme